MTGPLRAQSLTDTLITAYRNSNLLEQNRALLRAADEDTAIALAAIRPVIDYVGSVTYSDPRRDDDDLRGTADLVAQMTLYDFGRNRLAERAARLTVLATRQALLSVEQQVLLDAVIAHFDVRQAATVVDLQISNLELIRRELRAARDRFEVGEVTRTDVAVAEAREAAALSSLAAAQGSLAVAREGYKAAVGVYPNAPSAPGGLPRIASSLPQAREIALRTNPSIRQAQEEVRVTEAIAEQQKRGVLPTVTGDARVGIDDEGDDNSSVGITLSGPIYRGGALSAFYRQALASRDQARANLMQISLLVDEGVGNAWANLDVANARIVATEQEVRASRLAFEGLSEEASLGARTTLDVLNSEQDLLDAATDQAEALNDRFVSAYSLLAAMGLLTVDGLGLNVATYDPEAYYNAVRNAPATSTRGRRLDRVLETIGKN
ncbi:MAG: TolC family outer membrane protein [Pseudomonadota bacterium]